MEGKLAKLNAKLALLDLTRGKTDGIVGTGIVEKMCRQKEALQAIVGSTEEPKREVEEAKLENGESLDKVKEWGQEFEERIDIVDNEIKVLETRVKSAIAEAENTEREMRENLLAREREEQLKFERKQLEQKEEFSSKLKNSTQNFPSHSSKQSVKLPKLVITKYNGALENWLSFWNKFEAEIDKADLPAVTKFAYLKELVEPRVKRGIDGLPFSAEGYERAKNILKANYGKTSEIINAYVENILALPTISGTNAAKIHDFYETLLYNVQSLETLGKTSDCLALVRGVLNKLPGIKAELVQGKPEWKTWDFTQLIDALREWKEIHPRELAKSRDRSFYVEDHDPNAPRGCVFCNGTSHKPSDCTVISSAADRKKFLQEKRLCFNCTGPHRAARCRSRGNCARCKQRHHTSICDQSTQPANEGAAMTAAHVGEKVCHPVVIIKVNGVKCRALLDTGATGSYISAFLVNLLKVKPSRTLTRGIKTIMGLVTKRVETYDVKICDTQEKCVLPVCVTKIEQRELLTLENPNYPEMVERYPHLKGVRMEETDTKELLPIHVILGANEYTKIKMAGYQRAGAVGQPIAEQTRFGWTIMSSGAEVDTQNMFLTQTSIGDYEELCRMDVLGLQDTPIGDQEVVHQEFLEQLKRSPEGWYETALPWKGGHPPLPNNKTGSLKRLASLVQRLKRNGKIEDYDAIIQEQLREGIVEEAQMPAKGREFYIPHKAVIRENAETTKMRIVYDASARANDTAPSLNECLDAGPPLQNQLWKVLVRGRFYAVAIAGDIRKAFLQVRIREEDRDALRFHWISAEHPEQVRTLRFTRALFGLGPSPFLLGGVIQHHLSICRPDYPETVPEIERGLYVDDLLSGGQTVEKAREIKDTAREIFGKASFQLHKWNSNTRELEATDAVDDEGGVTYAKEQLGAKPEECGLLGLRWNKDADTIAVTFPQEVAAPTKRGVLGKVAKVYDPLGLAAPLTLVGKLIYRDACQQKNAWDAELSQELVKRWEKWEMSLPKEVEAPRALVLAREPIEAIALHAFGDASGQGVATAVYAVVQQESGVRQGLVAAKARLAKQGLTIPRLELVSGHMAANLLTNVHDALSGFPIASQHAWLDSSVALHWIKGAGEYKQFVGNRVRKIREKEAVVWRHVPTQENPADLASRGGPVNEDNVLWWEGPKWLKDPESWPPDIVTTATTESNAEVKATKELFALAVEQEDELDNLLAKLTYWRTLRVCAWMMRFIRNARTSKSNRAGGPLTTEEIEEQKHLWLLRVQTPGVKDMEKDRLRLNLQKNQDGVLECRGRLQGIYPIYVPDSTIFAEKLVQHAHLATLHGGVSLTMAKVREQHWIPRLRRLVKKVIKQCYGCKRFQAIAVAAPPPGLLPLERTEHSSVFEVVGVDFAGPIKYKKSPRVEGKAYLVLFACSLTRALYLEVLPNQETTTFLGSLKRLIARRGRPTTIFSDNGRTFIGAAHWLKEIQKDEQLQAYLAEERITWRFNLSRAPWWGGQFERLVGVFKRAFYKTIGGGMLSWTELCEVVLEVETQLNRRPLSYVEEDVQLPLLTPASFLFQKSNRLPEREPWREENVDLRKRAKYLKACKDALWKRWSREYLVGLRERHNLKHEGHATPLRKGDVVIIKDDDRNRNKWKLGIIENLIAGRDGIVRVAKLRAGKAILERAIQQLYPLELTCDRAAVESSVQLNPRAPVFRPRRDAAVAANLRIQDIATETD